MRSKSVIIKNVKSNLIEYVYIFTLLICSSIFFKKWLNLNIDYKHIIPKYYIIPISVLANFIFIKFALPSHQNNDINIYSEKTMVKVFLLNFAVLIFIYYVLVLNSVVLFKDSLSIEVTLLAILFVTSLKKIIKGNFRVNIKFLLISFISILIYKGIQVFFLGFDIINSYDSSWSLLLKVLSLTLYPSLYEEILFRFIAIGAIKSFDLDDITTNIIQSLLFGLIHIFTYLLGGIGITYAILGCAGQALLGYILGMVYMRTKSLSYSIFLHTLYNLI